MLNLIDAINDPFNKGSPTTTFKIHRTVDGMYQVTKVLEDGEAKFVSGATVAVFDSATGRLFVGGTYGHVLTWDSTGAATPFVMVCEPTDT